jgi:hypothetical protein
MRISTLVLALNKYCSKMVRLCLVGNVEVKKPDSPKYSESCIANNANLLCFDVKTSTHPLEMKKRFLLHSLSFCITAPALKEISVMPWAIRATL